MKKLSQAIFILLSLTLCSNEDLGSKGECIYEIWVQDKKIETVKKDKYSYECHDYTLDGVTFKRVAFIN